MIRRVRSPTSMAAKSCRPSTTPSATRTSANTTRAFMRAPGPSGSGFCVSVLAAAKRGLPPVGCFAPSFALFSMVAPRERPLSRGGCGRTVDRRGPSSHQRASANANNRDFAGDGVRLSGASAAPSGRLGFQVRGFGRFPNSVFDSAHFISFFLARAHKTPGAELCSASGTPGDRWG